MGGEAKDEEGKEVVTHEVGMKRASKYIADQMLESRHLQALHGVLSSVWNRNGQAQSLPAVIALMEQYGVQLEAHEVEQICGMDQDQQIAALVNRMPQDSQEQFQQFFLQLQLLVSTATRIRDGLEDGQIEKVELALEDADSTGVTQEILRMAVVQAGHEAAVQMQEYEAWVKDTDEQMGRLIRGQEEAMAAKKKLATLLGGLQQDRTEHSERATKVCLNFVEIDKGFTTNACFQSWSSWAKRAKEEATMTKSYQERIGVLRERRERYRSCSMHAIRSLLEKKAQAREAEMLQGMVRSWFGVVAERKENDALSGQVDEMNSRLAKVQGSQKETTKRVMERMNNANATNLLLQALGGWHGEVQEMKKNTGMNKLLAEAEARIRAYLKDKNEASLKVLKLALGGTDSNIATQAFACWKSQLIAAQEQAALEEAMKENRKLVQEYKDKHFAAANGAMSRALGRYEEGLLLDVFGHWRIESAVEHTMGRHEARLEAKRQQLQSIRQMFRTFALQLKNSISKSVDSDQVEKRPSLSAGRSRSQKLESVSLPDIHKSPTAVQDAPKTAWS